jgi:hypothetical protein
MHGRDEKCLQNVARKSDGKTPLGRSRRRWEDNMKMDLTEIGWEVVDWIYLAQ